MFWNSGLAPNVFDSPCALRIGGNSWMRSLMNLLLEYQQQTTRMMLASENAQLTGSQRLYFLGSGI
jgi:hypothetical protein